MDIQVSRAVREPRLSDAEARALVDETRWYHTFELRPGLWTKGESVMDAKPALDALGVPTDLSGMKCLDVGAWDGPLTFEMERRGAVAAALDVQDPKSVGYDTARRVTGSQSPHYQGSVYQLPFDELTNLDLVVFRGVYYHLKYPLLAFERLSAAMRCGGTLHFEGEGFISYAEDLNGQPVDKKLLGLAKSDVPVCLSYPNRYKRASNWSIPNAACLRSWLCSAGFEVNELHEFVKSGAQRLYGYATKVREESSLLEHPIYPGKVKSVP
jgi:tRNA (mo5U34)-methyltransferase